MARAPSRAGLAWLLGTLLVGAFASTVWSWSSGGIVATMLDAGTWSGGEVTRVRDAVSASGPLAPLVYVAFVTVEVVVAPLPGFLLYGPGGALFGGLLGGALALVGNVLGAAIAFGITRLFGRDRAAAWMRESELAPLERRLSERGFLVVLLLRLNPLTSSDLVSYAAGLTSMPASRMLAATAIGLAPLCFAQAYVAESLLARFPWLLWPALLAVAGYLLLMIAFARRVLHGRTEAQSKQAS